MVQTNYEYFNYINKNEIKNLFIYSCFQKIFGFGKNYKHTKLFYKFSGLNLTFNLNVKDFNFLNHKINIFILLNLFKKKIGDIIKLKINYFKNNKYSIGSYKYIRKSLGLPIRGQRTRTNARTSKILMRKVNEKINKNKK